MMKRQKVIVKAAAAVMAFSFLSMELAFAAFADEGTDLLNKIALSQGNISGEIITSQEMQKGEGAKENTGSLPPKDENTKPDGKKPLSEKEEALKNNTAPQMQQYIAETGGSYTAEYFEMMDIKEIYHEDYGIYEEAVNGVQFFYSTVPNGAITDEPVILEMPAGFDYALEKDGNPIYYESGTKITEKGTYVIRMAMLGDGLTPVNETTLYVGIFHFRIQDKKDRFLYGDIDDELMGSLEPVIPELPGADGSDIEVSTGETVSEIIEDAVGDGYSPDLQNFHEITGLKSGYDEETGFYRHELISGSSFLTDIPNGTTTNSSVTIIPDSDVLIKVMRNGKEVEYETGSLIEEEGSYVVTPYQDDAVYTSVYAKKAEPRFTFRIISGPVNDMGIYNAPQNAEITEVLLNGTNILKASDNKSWFFLDEDGSYTVKTKTESGTATVNIKKDTAAPRFYAELKANEANFAYGSPDIAYCVIKNGEGEVIHSGNAIGKLDEPGDYHMDVYDEAGNVSSVNFSLSYRMNGAAILVVLLIVLIIVGVIFYIKRIHSHMSVV